jgi:predicted nucleotidyltransferase
MKYIVLNSRDSEYQKVDSLEEAEKVVDEWLNDEIEDIVIYELGKKFIPNRSITFKDVEEQEEE